MGTAARIWLNIIGVALVATALSACQTKPSTEASTPVSVVPPREYWVYYVGDSYSGGSDEGGVGDRGWPALVRADLAAQDMTVILNGRPEGASGYANRGISKGVFADQLGPRQYTDLIVFFGSRNDGSTPLDKLATATRDTFEKAKASAPGAKLLVIGPLWPASELVPDGAPGVRDTVRAQAVDAGATFVDPMAEGWLDDARLIGADKVHPNDAGHRYLADRIEPLIKQALLGQGTA